MNLDSNLRSSWELFSLSLMGDYGAVTIQGGSDVI